MNAPFGTWGAQTFIAGLTHDSLIAPWLIKEAMDGDAFAAYIRDVLASELRPGTVTTSRRIATRSPPRSGRMAAGFFTCRHTLRI